MKVRNAIGALLLASFAQISAAAIIVHTADFIADGTRTAFNGFESIPNDGAAGGANFTGGFPYVEDGIAVEQVNGDGPGDIWVNCTLCFNPGYEGNYSWYPNGGDLGYTRITRVGGGDFSEVGFLTGSGWTTAPTTIFYELFQNGVSVLSGSINKAVGNAVGYLGFSGGGFDEIRVYDQGATSLNALAIDSIELRDNGSVPEPAALVLVALGLSALATVRRRQIRR